MNKTLLQRVEEEECSYGASEFAALDHLDMAHAHLFEGFEGRDVDDILTDIIKIKDKINSIINHDFFLSKINQ